MHELVTRSTELIEVIII